MRSASALHKEKKTAEEILIALRSLTVWGGSGKDLKSKANAASPQEDDAGRKGTGRPGPKSAVRAKRKIKGA